MASREDSDVDDDFSELYKEYTGPPRSNTIVVTEPAKTSKRSHAGSDEEEEESLDPNAVPTDFTSREAKVWEAKSKATERNWKKRKEEEMVCKICGDSSHFTQGCPSTLGASRKSQELFERVPARDPQVKALFTERVIRNIEKDIGCKIRMEEKFIIVSGKDGQILSKGVDAIHRIKNQGEKKGESNSNMDNRSRSPPPRAMGPTDSHRSRSPRGMGPTDSHRSRSPRGMGPTDSQRSFPSPRNPSRYNQRPIRQDKFIDDYAREEFNKYPKGSPKAYGNNDGARSRSTLSRSPAPPPPYSGYTLTDHHSHPVHWDADKRGYSSSSSSAFPQTLEELELEYKNNAMDIAKVRDKEEDEENYRHREAVREIRENYMKRLGMMREMHAKQWDEFLQVNIQRRQVAAGSGYGGGYNKRDGGYYGEYDNPNPPNNTMPMESRGGVRYPQLDNYPPNSSTFDEKFQRQRHEDDYNRY